MGGQIAGGGSVELSLSLGVFGEEGCLLLVASRGESVGTIGRWGMGLVWASREGISSPTDATMVRCRRKEIIWVQMIDPGMVRASHEAYCVFRQPNVDVL
jgi:hypothetical protein